MLILKRLSFTLLVNSLSHESRRHITVKKWRKLNGRPPSQCGPLAELPDWSYTDGRGYGPPTVGQKKRYMRDQEMAEKVVQYMEYMNTAKRMAPEKS